MYEALSYYCSVALAEVTWNLAGEKKELVEVELPGKLHVFVTGDNSQVYPLVYEALSCECMRP